MFWDSIQSVMSLVLMMAVGFVMTKRPWFGKKGEDFLSKLCMQVGIPLMMVENVYETCGTREQLLYLLKYFPIPFAIITFFLIIGVILSKALKVKLNRRGAFINVIGFSNTVFIGFPIVTAILGEEALPTAMSYYIGNTVLFWTAGAWFLRRDHDPNTRILTVENVKKMISPPIKGFTVGIILVLLDVELPAWIYDPIAQIGDTATPVAMLVIGSILRNINYKEIKMSADIAVLLLNRFIISPLIMLAVMMVLPLDNMAKQVYLILIIMPAMTQFGILAKETGADYEFCTVMIAVTTVASMIVIPFYTAILGMVF